MDRNAVKLEKKTRRKTISDSLITSEVRNKIIDKIYTTLDDAFNFTQLEVLDIMLPMNLSNAMMASIINEINPLAKATGGSVASAIRHLSAKDKMLQELLQQLED